MKTELDTRFEMKDDVRFTEMVYKLIADMLAFGFGIAFLVGCLIKWVLTLIE